MIIWRSVDPTKLQQQFRTDVEELLGPSEFYWYVIHGLRTMEEQDKLHKAFLVGGPKAAPAGKSPHNYGLAIDVVPDKDPDAKGLQPNWDTKTKAWRWLFGEIKLHPRLYSGVAFDDSDHIECYHWQRFISEQKSLDPNSIIST